jgi:16S rRNA (cytidine1402-2'-O)-methyltransferase
LVATPIGNLRDLSFRSLDILNQVDLILCEDTRKSLILLKEFNIKTKFSSLHEFTNVKKIDKYISYLESGKSIALISDAGTPLISDPGFEIVQKAKEKIF